MPRLRFSAIVPEPDFEDLETVNFDLTWILDSEREARAPGVQGAGAPWSRAARGGYGSAHKAEL